MDLATKLEKPGFWSRSAAIEPFTRLKRIELENLGQDYRQKLDDQRVVPAASAPRTGS
jgi:hypothetical protein